MVVGLKGPRLDDGKGPLLDLLKPSKYGNEEVAY
jgi:hypothetical protein